MGRLLALGLALLLLGDEDPATVSARKALETFRRDFASKEPRDRMEAIGVLLYHRHELIVKAVGERAFRDEVPEVRRVAAQLLGRMRGHTEEAGSYLRDELRRNDDHPDVQVAIARSIGLLGYRGARKELEETVARHFRDEAHRWVTDEVLRTFGVLKDLETLPFLLSLFEFEGLVPPRPDAPPTERARSDAEAKRRYEAKHGTRRIRPKGGGELVECWWWQKLHETLKILTEREFEDAKELRTWLEANARKLEIDPRAVKRRRRLRR